MFKTAKELDNAIKTVIGNSTNLRNEIQNVAIGIVVHAAGKGSGNVTRAKTLVDGLGEGVRRESLVEWFKGVGINFSEEGEVSLDKDLMTAENLTAMKSVDWWKAKPAPSPYKPMSYADTLVKTLKGMYKNYAEGQKEGNDCLLEKAEIEAFEQFVSKQAGAGNMPKRPECLKTKAMGTTKQSAAA